MKQDSTYFELQYKVQCLLEAMLLAGDPQPDHGGMVMVHDKSEEGGATRYYHENIVLVVKYLNASDVDHEIIRGMLNRVYYISTNVEVYDEWKRMGV